MKRLLLFTALLIAVPLARVCAQTHSDLGGMIWAKVSADPGRRWNVGLEEELRLRNNFTSFNRLSTTLDVDYTLIDRRLKIGALYAYIIDRTDTHITRQNHRFAAQAELLHETGRFRLSLRGRFQSTLRQEVEKRYNVNPKNYIRVKIGAQYTPWGSRMNHSLSAEPFYLLDPYGNSISKIRIEYSSQYRLDRRQKLEWSLRLDTPVRDREEPLIIQLGIGYRFQL